MFGLSAAIRVYFAKEPADMRKSFDALADSRLANPITAMVCECDTISRPGDTVPSHCGFPPTTRVQSRSCRCIPGFRGQFVWNSGGVD